MKKKIEGGGDHFRFPQGIIFIFVGLKKKQDNILIFLFLEILADALWQRSLLVPPSILAGIWQ